VAGKSASLPVAITKNFGNPQTIQIILLLWLVSLALRVQEWENQQ